MTGIRVGVASVDFTPELGLPLMGNFRDDYAARGVHDPLWAKAVVFADEYLPWLAWAGIATELLGAPASS